MATSALKLERLGAMLTPPASTKRMLVIANPYATTVSDRLRNLVVYALRGRYEVEAVDTEAPGHATEICREAALEGYDVVVAFGGDGTINEAANGLAGSDTPLSCLPGGATNVYCRLLGIPAEIVDATEHLLALADDFRPRTVDLARVNDRHFTFSAGLGLDATVVKRVEAHPYRKARFGAYYFTLMAFTAFAREYLVRPPRLVVEADGRRIEGVTAVVQNADPYTYFASRPIKLAEGATLDSGALSGLVLQRASPLDEPTLVWRAFSRKASMARHRHVDSFSGVDGVRARSLDGRPIALQVDGDYVGEVTEAEYSVTPRGLTVLA
ncbi:MAG TPA: diacylglycerol kinase family protein [Solirubrobacteraceae bacterium]|nr:diacylglycerol kinase family protein [Solirubrobacteraceae bacterium]